MSRRLLFAWWYASIAAGFVLLAIRTWLIGDPWWGILLRVIIAAGFAMLSAFEFRSRRPR